ncbi:hypothetical protein F4679DRAFT_102947 [Xylaria curta]|nr:hypothetical protein F4679DRAFT_102947 [Xylaria curta]
MSTMDRTMAMNRAIEIWISEVARNFEATGYAADTIPYFAPHENGKNSHDVSAAFNQPRPFSTTKSRRLTPPENRGRNKKALTPADPNRLFFSHMASSKENSSLPPEPPEARHRKQGTPEEDRALLGYRTDRHSWPYITNKLGRTTQSCQSRLKVLGKRTEGDSLDELPQQTRPASTTTEAATPPTSRLETLSEPTPTLLLRKGASDFTSPRPQDVPVDLQLRPASTVSGTASDFADLQISPSPTVSAPVSGLESSWHQAIPDDVPSTNPSVHTRKTRDSKTRGKNPIQNRDDLLSVNIKYLDIRDNPSKMTDLIKALWLNQTGLNTIPSIIREQVEAATVYPLQDNFFTTEYHLLKEEALSELTQLQSILRHAKACKAESRAEHSWNIYVQSRIFDIAFDQADNTIQALDTMSATIAPKLAPTFSSLATTIDQNSGRTVAEMVDYCLTIEPKDQEGIRQICDCEPEGLGIFNQSTYPPLRHRPIGVAVETRIETAASAGEPQLGIWTKAWLDRMCQLRDLAINTDPGAPPLPLLRIRGDEWYVLFAYYESTENPNQSQQQSNSSSSKAANSSPPTLFLLGELPIGGTRHIWDAYRLLKSLRLIAKWTEGEFRHYIDDVVVPDAIRIFVRRDLGTQISKS